MANKNTNPGSGEDDNEMRIQFGLILALCQNCAISHNPLFHTQNSNLFKGLPDVSTAKRKEPDMGKRNTNSWEGQRPHCPQPPKSSYLKNSTITSVNFHSSKGPSPEVSLKFTIWIRPANCRICLYPTVPYRGTRRTPRHICLCSPKYEARSPCLSKSSFQLSRHHFDFCISI